MQPAIATARSWLATCSPFQFPSVRVTFPCDPRSAPLLFSLYMYLPLCRSNQKVNFSQDSLGFTARIFIPHLCVCVGCCILLHVAPVPGSSNRFVHSLWFRPSSLLALCPAIISRHSSAGPFVGLLNYCWSRGSQVIILREFTAPSLVAVGRQLGKILGKSHNGVAIIALIARAVRVSLGPLLVSYGRFLKKKDIKLIE